MKRHLGWLINWAVHLAPVGSSLARRPKPSNQFCLINRIGSALPGIWHLQCPYVVEIRQWLLWRSILARYHIRCNRRPNQHNDKRSPRVNNAIDERGVGWFTFRNPLVRLMPLPWISKGWKKTVSPREHSTKWAWSSFRSIICCWPMFISKWMRSVFGSNFCMPWYILFTPPWRECCTELGNRDNPLLPTFQSG